MKISNSVYLRRKQLNGMRWRKINKDSNLKRTTPVPIPIFQFLEKKATLWTKNALLVPSPNYMSWPWLQKNESRLCHLSCLERDNNSSFGSIQSSLGGMLSEPWVVVEASASGLTQIASLKPNWTSIKEGQKVPIHLKNVFIFQGDLSIDSPEPFNLCKVTFFPLDFNP